MNSQLKVNSDMPGLSSTAEVQVDDIMSLIDAKVYAILIPGYCRKQVCGVVSKKLIDTNCVKKYHHAAGIGCVGMCYEMENSMKLFSKYYRDANKNIKKVRNMFSPYQSPMDKLRLNLQEIWPAGANLENLYGKNMFVGLLQVLEKGTDILPHQNVLKRDAPNALLAHTLEAQLAVNIYLQMPTRGGEIELWSQTCGDAEYQSLLIKQGEYATDRNKIGKPAMTFKPRAGDLVIFNARKF